MLLLHLDFFNACATILLLIFHVVLISQMTHGKIFTCWQLYNSALIYSIYSWGRIALTHHTENSSLTIIVTVWNINEILPKTYSSVCGKTLSSSRCQFNSAYICSYNHINYESIICTSVESHRVEFACMVFIPCCANKASQCRENITAPPLKTIPGLLVTICEDDMWNYIQGKP